MSEDSIEIVDVVVCFSWQLEGGGEVMTMASVDVTSTWTGGGKGG